MREVIITDECLEFIVSQRDRVSNKFFEIIEVISTLKIVHSLFIKKLTNTEFYELRIRARNEYRSIIFTLDDEDFHRSSKIICLYAFQKKSTKDYKKAIKKARIILDNIQTDSHEKNS